MKGRKKYTFVLSQETKGCRLVPILNQLLWACKHLRAGKIHLSSNWADPGVYKPFWVPLRCGTALHRRLQMFIGTHLNKTTPPSPPSCTVTKQRETFWLQFLFTVSGHCETLRGKYYPALTLCYMLVSTDSIIILDFNTVQMFYVFIILQLVS